MGITSGAASLGDARGRIILDPAQVLSGVRQAQDAARAGFQGMSNSIRGVGDTLTSVGGAMTRLLLPIKAVGALGVKTYADFDSVLSEIAARTGATAQEMDKVRKVSLQMGQDTSFSANQAAQAILELLSSGYDLNEAFAALPDVLNAAAAGALDLGYTSDIVTDALAMWGLGADQAGRVADALARGASASSAEMNDLAQGLSNVGPLANEFGLSLEDTVAILAAFSERGIKGAAAGDQLKTMLTQMSRDTKDATDTWDALGISMFDATGQVRPLQDVMAELRNAFEGMTDQERITTIKTLAGSFGQLGLSILTASPAMEDMNALMGKQADAAAVAEARLNNLNGIFGMIKSSLDTLLINAMGPNIENGLKPMLRSVIDVLNQINQWVMLNPELTSQIVSMLSVLITVGPTLYTIGTILKFVAPMFTVYGKVVGVVAKLLPLLLSPMGLLLAAAIGLAVAWHENLFGIQDFINQALEPIQFWLWQFEYRIRQIADALLSGDFSYALAQAKYLIGDLMTFLQARVIPAVTEWAGTMLDRFVGWAQEAGPRLITALGDLLNQFVGWAIGVAPQVAAQLLAWANVFVAWVGPMIPALIERLGQIAGQIIAWAVGQVPIILAQLQIWATAFVDWVSPAIPLLIAALLILANQMIGWIGQKTSGLLEKLGEWGAAFVDWVIPAAANLLLELPGLIADLLIWILEVTPQIVVQLLHWATAFIEWVGPLVADLIVEMGKVAGALIEWVLPMIPELWAKLLEVTLAFVAWITTEFVPAILVEIPGVVAALISFVYTAITEIGPAFLEFQTAIGNFFVNDLIPAVWTNAKTVGSSIINGIKDGLSNAGQEIFNFLKEKLLPYMNTELIPGSGISMNNLGAIVGSIMDFGGPLAAGEPALIGKGAQPELFVPKQDMMAFPRGTYSMGDTISISIGITPDTIRQYPNAGEYAQTVGESLEQRLSASRRALGGGVVSG